jgi:hypothetical protein
MHDQELTATVTATGIIEQPGAELGLTEARMAGFTLILVTGLTVGFARGTEWGLLFSAVAAAGTTLLLAAVYRVRAVRQFVMGLMHRITGQ